MRARVAHCVIVAIALGLALTVMRPSAGHAQAAPAAPAPTQEGPGHFFYQRDCAYCHAADATGTVRGPSLQGVGRAAVDFWLTTGRMPLETFPARDPSSRVLQPLPQDELADANAVPKRHNPAYPPAVITQIEDYVAAIAPGGMDVPSVSTTGADLAAGGETYRLECAACHSWAANGGALYQREAPSLAASTPTQIAEAVRTGPDQMPAFGTSAVSDAQLAGIVAYVRYLAHPDDRGGQPLWHLGPVAEGGVALIGAMGMLLLLSRWIGERT